MKNIIDISSNSTIVTAESLKQYDGVYIKATEGGTWPTPNLDYLISLVRQAGVPYGLYHYAGLVHTALEEYTFFKKQISKYNDRILPDCLDYEQGREDLKFISDFMSYDNSLIFYSYQSLCFKTGIPKDKIWIAIIENIPTDLNGYFGIQYGQNLSNDGIKDYDISLFSDSVITHAITINNIKESVKMQAIVQGENSNRVKLLQSILNVLINAGLAVDGSFGNNTLNAVKTYQRIMGIEVDGMAGVQTITTLLNDIKGNWFKLSN